LRKGNGHESLSQESPPVQCRDYLLRCRRYSEGNPVEAGIADEPWPYTWSSARGEAEALLAEKGSTWVGRTLWNQRRGVSRSWHRGQRDDEGGLGLQVAHQAGIPGHHLAALALGQSHVRQS
jgi:hypothetical protein